MWSRGKFELPKLPGVLSDGCSRLELWAKFINSEKREDFEMLAEKDHSISSAFQQLHIISRDREKRLEYEAREKAILDHSQFLFKAEQRGIQIGEQRGEQRGIQLATGRINKLISLLVRDGRYDDIKRSAAD